MHSLKALALCLLVATMSSSSIDAAGYKTRRHLRAQHDGIEVGGEAGVPGYVPGGGSAMTPSPALVAGAPAVQNTGVSTVPGSSVTNVNVTPGTVNTNVNITPGTSTTTVSAPVAPAAPRPVAPAPAPAPASPLSGLNFGSLLGGGGNPLTGVATMAHVAHGALLGHTGTLPSSYMQSKSGGGH